MKSSMVYAAKIAVSVWLFAFFLLSAHKPEAAAQKEGELATSFEYQQRQVLETSLFRSDKDMLGEEAIQRILASKFVLPETIKIALLKIQDNPLQAVRYYGYGYWRSEEYLKMQQSFITIVADEISKSERVIEVASLPSLLTPKEPTIPAIRETAVRLQSDMVLVFRLSSDVYEKSRFLQSQAKAFCTCEGFLLDVRTGLIPFSKIITKEFLATPITNDANFNETMARAEREAALLSLKTLGEDTVAFLSLIPKPDAVQQTQPAGGKDVSEPSRQNE